MNSLGRRNDVHWNKRTCPITNKEFSAFGIFCNVLAPAPPDDALPPQPAVCGHSGLACQATGPSLILRPLFHISVSPAHVYFNPTRPSLFSFFRQKISQPGDMKLHLAGGSRIWGGYLSTVAWLCILAIPVLLGPPRLKYCHPRQERSARSPVVWDLQWGSPGPCGWLFFSVVAPSATVPFTVPVLYCTVPVPVLVAPQFFHTVYHSLCFPWRSFLIILVGGVFFLGGESACLQAHPQRPTFCAAGGLARACLANPNK